MAERAPERAKVLHLAARVQKGMRSPGGGGVRIPHDLTGGVDIVGFTDGAIGQRANTLHTSTCRVQKGVRRPTSGRWKERRPSRDLAGVVYSAGFTEGATGQRAKVLHLWGSTLIVQKGVVLCAVIARPSYDLAGGVDVIGAAVGVRKLARAGVVGQRTKVFHTST